MWVTIRNSIRSQARTTISTIMFPRNFTVRFVNFFLLWFKFVLQKEWGKNVPHSFFIKYLRKKSFFLNLLN